MVDRGDHARVAGVVPKARDMKARMVLIVVSAAFALAASLILLRVGGAGDRFGIALQLMEQDRGDEAAVLLDDPLWRGVAEYQSGRYRRAAEAFSNAEDVMSLYNLGNAHAQLGAWDEASRAYQAALRLEPDHNDATFNLDLVTQAKELEEELAEAARKVRQSAETGAATDAINKKGETATEDPDGGSRRSVGDAEAGDDVSQSSGEASQPGRAAERDAAESATGATATLYDGDELSETKSDGTGNALILRQSTQEAEILLRHIKDDPARVLRARLRAAHRARQERTSQ